MNSVAWSVTGLTVRLATLEEDWDRLSVMRELAEERMRELGHETDFARGLDRMASYIHLDRLYVTCQGRALLACHALTPDGDPAFWTPDELREDALYLDNAMIHPSCAHRGIGHLITWHARDEAAERGMRLLRLDCQRVPELRAHWEHLGFTWLRDVEVPGRASGTLMEASALWQGSSRVSGPARSTKGSGTRTSPKSSAGCSAQWSPGRRRRATPRSRRALTTRRSGCSWTGTPAHLWSTARVATSARIPSSPRWACRCADRARSACVSAWWSAPPATGHAPRTARAPARPARGRGTRAPSATSRPTTPPATSAGAKTARTSTQETRTGSSRACPARRPCSSRTFVTTRKPIKERNQKPP